MRTFALLLLLVILLAGCGARNQDDGTSVPTSGTGDTSGTIARTDPATGTDSGTPSTASYDLAADLEFDYALVRYALVAQGNVTVRFTAESSTPSVAFRNGCSAVSAHHESPENGSAALVLVAWMQNANVYAEATVAGQRVPIVPNQFPDNSAPQGSVELSGGVEAYLSEGERFIVELGGSSSETPAPSFVANLTVEGAARLERLAPAPLACGTGLREAEGSTVGLNTYLVTTSAGGALGFTSTNATTLLAVAVDATDGKNKGHVQFLDEPEVPLPGEVAMSAPMPGDAAIVLEQWADAAGQVAWLFADSYWPMYGTDA